VRPHLLFDLPASLSPCLLSSFLPSVIVTRLVPYLPYRTRTELDLRKVFRSLCPRPHLIIMLPRDFDVGHILRVLLSHTSHACSDPTPLSIALQEPRVLTKFLRYLQWHDFRSLAMTCNLAETFCNTQTSRCCAIRLCPWLPILPS
jgi:hypothetical protein